MNQADRGDGKRGSRRFTVDCGFAVILMAALLAVIIIDRSIPAKIDIVFILDQRPVMRELISGMKANCSEKVSTLNASGADCRFAVIPFGKKRSRVPSIPLSDDLERFKKQLSTPVEGPIPELAGSAAEAIDKALMLDFRKQAQVIFFVISKNPFESEGEVTKLAERMRDRPISVIVQADADAQARCKSLCETGRFFSLEGADLTAKYGSGTRRASRASSLLSQLAPGSPGGSSKVGEVKGIYGLRTNPNRQAIIARLGATAESEIAVQNGLEWLARHQAEEGYWSDAANCESDQPCIQLKYNAPIAETGLAILAFQAGGHYYFNDQEYSNNVKHGLNWLVEQQGEDGRFFSGVAHHNWYEHGIATFAMSEACAVARASDRAPDERYLAAARRAVTFIETYQYARGGWQYAVGSQSMGDTSVSGWQVLALMSAKEAGIEVDPSTLNRACKFFENCGDPASGLTGYQARGGGTSLTTAVGLIVQLFILKQPNSDLSRKAIVHLRRLATEGIGRGEHFYTLYNANLAMFLAGGDAWKEWNDNVRDEIIRRQEKVGCARGSWNHTHHRTLSTAWAVLALEVYYRYSLGADAQ